MSGIPLVVLEHLRPTTLAEIIADIEDTATDQEQHLVLPFLNMLANLVGSSKEADRYLEEAREAR